jgi:hypothetical protein
MTPNLPTLTPRPVFQIRPLSSTKNERQAGTYWGGWNYRLILEHSRTKALLTGEQLLLLMTKAAGTRSQDVKTQGILQTRQGVT